MPECRCGCGTEISEGRKYVIFHNLAKARNLPSRIENLRRAAAEGKRKNRKKRKYKKRDKKYWNHDGTVKKAVMSPPSPQPTMAKAAVVVSGSRMTDYIIPAELQKELDRINFNQTEQAQHLTSLNRTTARLIDEVERLDDKIDSMVMAAKKEEQGVKKLKWSGVG